MHGLWISHIGFSGFKTKYGAIAQLGERHTGSVEVSGSIPLSSTNKDGGCSKSQLSKGYPILPRVTNQVPQFLK